MANVKFANRASSKLISTITPQDTVFYVLPGFGELFPVITEGQWFYVTLIDPSGNMEIVRVVGRSGDRFTVERGVDNTTAIAFSNDSIVELRLNAAAIEDINPSAGKVETWSDDPNYIVPTIIYGTDGVIYEAVQNSGPDYGGAVDPTTDTSWTHWRPYRTTPAMSWNSGTKYTVPSLVIGSNNSLYMSTQESGPGTDLGPLDPVTDTTAWKSAIPAEVYEKYELCEIYYFRNPTVKAGFAVCNGSVVEKFSTVHPKAAAYLKDSGEYLVTTAEKWEEISKSFGGIGGVPYFTYDETKDEVKLPDLRGMFTEGSGLIYTGETPTEVGESHTDFVQDHNHSPYTGCSFTSVGAQATLSAWGPTNNFKHVYQSGGIYGNWGGYDTKKNAIYTAPRAWMALPCIYLGGTN